MQINTYIATFGFGLDILPILHLRNLGSDLQWCLSWYYSWAPWYVHTPPTQNEEITLGHLPMLETRAGKLECRQKCKFGTNALLLSRFCNACFELRLSSPLLITRNAEHLIISRPVFPTFVKTKKMWADVLSKIAFLWKSFQAILTSKNGNFLENSEFSVKLQI